MDSRHCMKILYAVQITMIRFVGEVGGTPYDSMEKLKIKFYPGDLCHIWETPGWDRWPLCFCHLPTFNTVNIYVVVQ